MDKVPIKFTHQQKEYSGYFSAVSGAGSTRVWHLMINNYYCGRLRYSEKWVFDPTPKNEGFKNMADYFGECVTAQL